MKNRERDNARVNLDGSAESRAIARLLAQQRTAKPKLSQFDEDAHLIYGRISCMGYDLVPSSWDIRHTPVYARGMEVSNMLCGPIVPSHLDEHLKRFTRASGEFEFCFGREPVVGDILRFHQVALVHYPDIIEMKTSLFVQAWERRLGELPCPLKFENGRLFKRVTRGRPGSTPEWIEDLSVTAQAIWLEIEKVIKWRELGMALPAFCQGDVDFATTGLPNPVAFKFFKIDVPNSTKTRAHDINARNQIVGLYNDSNDNQHGFLFAHKRFVTIDVPGSVAYTSARRINSSGVIVGGYLDSSAAEHGFLLKDSIFTTIDFPGASSTGAYGINDAGVVVGCYVDTAGATHGFSLRNGKFHPLDAPGFPGTTALAINNAGTIVGIATDANSVDQGYVLTTKQEFIFLQVPGATSTDSYGINDSGDVVGFYTDSSGAVHGFVEHSGSFQTVDFPQAFVTRPLGINAQGKIVGDYILDSGNNFHGFLAVPDCGDSVYHEQRNGTCDNGLRGPR